MQIVRVVFQTDLHIPADRRRQIQYRGLRIQSIQHKGVEKGG
jgi:hypothetical protein